MLSCVLLLSLLRLSCPAAEKLFHSRDRADAEIPAAQHAELIVDPGSARQFLTKYGFITDINKEEVGAEEEYFLYYSGQGLTDFLPQIEEDGSLSREGRHRQKDSIPVESPEFISGLKRFQMLSGLPVTGVFDDATKAAMNKPRCGVMERNPDNSVPLGSTGLNSTAVNMTVNNGSNIASNSVNNGSKSQASSQLSRKKRHLRTLIRYMRQKRELGSTGQMALPKKNLKWRLIGEGYSNQLSIDDQRYIFKLAFRMWSEVSPLEFEEDLRSPLDNVDIKLGFGTGRHLGCTQSFDGAGREFAHAWFLGDIHFDDDEHFAAISGGSGISLLKVAVHEIGHVLGLPHIYRPGSIMQPSYLPQDASFEIDWLDRKAIQQLYGGCRGSFSTVFDWIRKERTPYGEVVIRFNTYFMRGGWYWLYENRNNRTRYGDPVSVRAGWHGIPAGGVDAYVHVWSWTTEAVYFFKGTQYWRYDSENDQVFREDSDGNKYPKLISEGFPGISGPIDTAFYDRREAHIYFFKGMEVYRFDVGARAVASGFPKKISEVFPAVVPGDHPKGNLDAAYFSYTHNAVFLLKGTRFWKIAGSRDRRLRPSLPRNGLLPQREVEEQWFDICNVHSTSLKMSH